MFGVAYPDYLVSPQLAVQGHVREGLSQACSIVLMSHPDFGKVWVIDNALINSTTTFFKQAIRFSTPHCQCHVLVLQQLHCTTTAPPDKGYLTC